MAKANYRGELPVIKKSVSVSDVTLDVTPDTTTNPLPPGGSQSTALCVTVFIWFLLCGNLLKFSFTSYCSV